MPRSPRFQKRQANKMTELYRICKKLAPNKRQFRPIARSSNDCKAWSSHFYGKKILVTNNAHYDTGEEVTRQEHISYFH
jgi:hypothetical protein